MPGYGYTSYFNVDLSNTVVDVKADEAKLHSLEVETLNLAESWILLFNKAAADVNFGTISGCANHADGNNYTASAAHGLSVGDIIVHEGFTNAVYNGQKTVITIVDTTHYTTSDTYAASETGTFIDKPAHSYRTTYGDGVAYYGSYSQNWGDLGVDFSVALSIMATTSPCGIAAPTNGLLVNIDYQ